MTQLTEHAKTILRAIADGKQIEYHTPMTQGRWEPVSSASHAIQLVHKGMVDNMRIKPETRSINGVKFGAPMEGSDFIGFGERVKDAFQFLRMPTIKDRDTAYQAIVDALEGKTK